MVNQNTPRKFSAAIFLNLMHPSSAGKEFVIEKTNCIIIEDTLMSTI